MLKDEGFHRVDSESGIKSFAMVDGSEVSIGCVGGGGGVESEKMVKGEGEEMVKGEVEEMVKGEVWKERVSRFGWWVGFVCE